jgi:hypothetical protein
MIKWKSNPRVVRVMLACASIAAFAIAASAGTKWK